jgi:tetratricopeptide (TPR) repeat protein
MLGVSLLNTFSNIPPSAMAFWFLLGLQAFEAAPEGASSKDGKLAGLGVAAALAFVFVFFAGRELHAQRILREGLRKKKTEELALSATMLRKAAEMNIQEFTPQTSVGVWYELGEVLRSGGAVDQAIDAYKRDFEANPSAPETHNMLGAALGQRGKNEEAMEYLREAVRLSPGYAAALLNLGITYVSTGNYSGAAKAWADAKQADTANAQADAYLLQLEKIKKR